MNIGYSCRLLTDDMKEVFVIDADDEAEVKDQLKSALDQIGNPNIQIDSPTGEVR